MKRRRVRRRVKGAKYGSLLTGLDMPRQGAGPRPRLESYMFLRNASTFSLKKIEQNPSCLVLPGPFFLKHANTYIQYLGPQCIQLLCQGGYPKESGVFAKQVNNNRNQLCLHCAAAQLRAPETESQLSEGFIWIHIYSHL